MCEFENAWESSRSTERTSNNTSTYVCEIGYENFSPCLLRYFQVPSPSDVISMIFYLSRLPRVGYLRLGEYVCNRSATLAQRFRPLPSLTRPVSENSVMIVIH